MFDNSEQLLLSWIHEYAFCPRRFYLRIEEGQNATNLDMIEGTLSHQKVDQNHKAKRGNEIQVFGLEVGSDHYQLYGICDRVDFCVDKENGVYIPFLKEKCIIHPVEFKHGRKRNADDYCQQLCAQAMCLEDMYSAVIHEGTIWFTGVKQSELIEFSNELRSRTLNTIQKIKMQIKSNEYIPAYYRKLCNKCAMFDVCNPKNDMSKKYVETLKRNLIDGD